MADEDTLAAASGSAYGRFMNRKRDRTLLLALLALSACAHRPLAGAKGDSYAVLKVTGFT